MITLVSVVLYALAAFFACLLGFMMGEVPVRSMTREDRSATNKAGLGFALFFVLAFILQVAG